MTARGNVVRVISRVVALSLLFALATAWLGWWSVPVLALGYAITDHAWRMRAATAVAAAVVAWSGIIAIDVRAAWSGASRAGAVVGASPAVLLIVTLVFGALLAGTAAVVGTAISDRIRSP